MQLFWPYIKQRGRELLALGLFSLIFLVSFVLYRLPIGAVLYPAILCLVLFIIFIGIDFRRVQTRHKRLEELRSAMDVTISNLPQAERIEDADYQQIIRLLCEEQSVLVTEQNLRYSNMVEYYTIWAHQIKTPIASMRLHLQNEDSALNRQLSLDLFRIEQYVEMVLMFLRLDSESTDYVIKEYDLDTVVRGAIKKFAGEFIARKLVLCYEPLETKVVTDEKWLSFVLEQILSNALKYTTEGSITISLKKPTILCITDTGMGIALEDLPRIFEKGYTGYLGRKDKKASGIGLYLCKRICKNLGHRIWAESVPGQGTTVFIDLTQQKLQVE